MIDRATLDHEGAAGQPLFERLSAVLAARIRGGLFIVGERLPSIRAMAHACDLSPDTVVRAYQRLVDQGIVRAARGSGFYVATRVSSPRCDDRPAASVGIPLQMGDWRRLLRTDIPLERRPGTGIIDWGAVAGDDVPRAVRAAARTLGGLPYDHSDTRGYLPLRIEIQRKLEADGIECSPDHIFTGGGATGALNLIVRALVRPTDIVLMEEPGPFLHQALLMSQGAYPTFIPRQRTGPDLEALRDACARHRPQLFFLSSLIQNPSGTSITPSHAHDLLRMAEEFDLTIVDDASLADVWTADPAGPKTLLAQLDRRRRVVHVGSFSTVFSPASRVGFLVATNHHAEWFDVFRPVQGLGNAVLVERILYQFLAEGHYRRRAARLARHIATNRSALLSRLTAAGLQPAEGTGPYLWQSLGQDIDSTTVAAGMLRHGFLAAPGPYFGYGPSIGSQMRLNVTTTSDEAVRELTRQIGISRPAP